MLSFKAGKCKMEEKSAGKYVISPDTRKGTISLSRTTDGVLHFRWLDRTATNTVVDYFSIVPNETSFAKVNTGKESDRVYILKWKQPAAPVATSSSRTATPRHGMN